MSEDVVNLNRRHHLLRIRHFAFSTWVLQALGFPERWLFLKGEDLHFKDRQRVWQLEVLFWACMRSGITGGSQYYYSLLGEFNWMSCMVTMFHELSCSPSFCYSLVFVMNHHASSVVFLGQCNQYARSPCWCSEKFMCDSPGKFSMCWVPVQEFLCRRTTTWGEA